MRRGSISLLARRVFTALLLPGQILVPALLALPALRVPQASAHLPEYFGRRYVLEAAQPVPAESRCGGDRMAMREQAEALREDYEQRRGAVGAYSVTLTDPAGELAKLYAALCNHPAALELTQEALHRLRISDGLLTPAQLPLLKALAESYLAIGDYSSAQLSLRYAFRVHGMGLSALERSALSDSLEYFALARQIFIDPRLPGDLDLFYQALLDNEAMLEAQRAQAEVDFATLQAIALSHLHNLYLLLGTDLSRYSSGTGPGGSPAWDFLQRRQALTFAKGVRVLEDLLAEVPAQSAPVRAALHLQLGNWQHWNGRWQRSCDSYALAWQSAAQAGSAGAALQEQLSTPAELPEDTTLWVFLRNPEIPAVATIEADFRVSARGDVSRVDARIVGEGSSGIAGRLARWLRDSHMRPAVGPEGCIDGTLTARRYRLLD